MQILPCLWFELQSQHGGRNSTDLCLECLNSQFLSESVDENRKADGEGSLEGKSCPRWGSRPPAKSSSPVRLHWLERKNIVIKHRAGRTLSFSHGTALSASPRARRTQRGWREMLIYALHTQLSSCRSSSAPRGSSMSPRALSCTLDRQRDLHEVPVKSGRA